MENKHQLATLLSAILALMVLMGILSNVLSESKNPDLVGAEFLVS